jgi:pyruvate dehydrogenase E2 component (dihydrolipoamide acetyltransferase)
MATKVHMEALSPTMEEGQLVRWLKSEGDEIAEGDVLAEIETDKATMELVARGAGVLRKVMLGEGETAPVGQVIGVIGGADEDVGDLGGGTAGEGSGGGAGGETAGDTAGEGDAAAVEAPAAEAEEASAAGRREERAAAPSAPDAGRGQGDGRIKASPLARRLASEAGLDLSGVTGTGPGGRITKADIEAASAAGAGAGGGAGVPAGVTNPVPSAGGAEMEEVPVSQMRKTIAKRLATSIGPVPTFYLTVDVDMTRMVEVRESVNRRLEKQGVKTSINDFILRAVASALARHPEVNASWGESVIRRHHRVHLGIAVAIEDGLITPIVRDAHLKGVAAIAAEVRELAGRAREKKLKPDEYTGATFSVSNLGMFGIEEFTAIINPPEAAILAVGRVEERVVAVDGQPAVRSRMKMTMSCDHRVIDGATGARFLQTLQSYLEEPVMMLV